MSKKSKETTEETMNRLNLEVDYTLFRIGDINSKVFHNLMNTYPKKTVEKFKRMKGIK